MIFLLSFIQAIGPIGWKQSLSWQNTTILSPITDVPFRLLDNRPLDSVSASWELARNVVSKQHSNIFFFLGQSYKDFVSPESRIDELDFGYFPKSSAYSSSWGVSFGWICHLPSDALFVQWAGDVLVESFSSETSLILMQRRSHDLTLILTGHWVLSFYLAFALVVTPLRPKCFRRCWPHVMPVSILCLTRYREVSCMPAYLIRECPSHRQPWFQLSEKTYPLNF